VNLLLETLGTGRVPGEKRKEARFTFRSRRGGNGVSFLKNREYQEGRGGPVAISYTTGAEGEKPRPFFHFAKRYAEVKRRESDVGSCVPAVTFAEKKKGEERSNPTFHPYV